MSHGLVAYGETPEGKYYAVVVMAEKGESRDRADGLIRNYCKLGLERILYWKNKGQKIS